MSETSLLTEALLLRHIIMRTVARATLAAMALASLSTTALAAQTASHPDVTGVWTMDTTKFAKHDAALSALRLTVSERSDTLVLHAVERRPRARSTSRSDGRSTRAGTRCRDSKPSSTARA